MTTKEAVKKIVDKLHPVEAINVMNVVKENPKSFIRELIIQIKQDVVENRHCFSSGLPELKGSDKQVSWANDIREKMIDKILAIIGHENKNQLIQAMQKQLSAKWYIDKRNVKDRELVTYYGFKPKISLQKESDMLDEIINSSMYDTEEKSGSKL